MQVRDWSCKECGSGWLEEIGKVTIEKGETENVYCAECKKRTTFEHCIRESDDTEDLTEPAFLCTWCQKLLPAEELESYTGVENMVGAICHDCSKNSIFTCSICKRTLPIDEREYFESIELAGTHSVDDVVISQCQDCVKKQQKYHIGDSVIIADGKKLKAGVVGDTEFDSIEGEWTYRVGINETDFTWVGQKEIVDPDNPLDRNTQADLEV